MEIECKKRSHNITGVCNYCKGCYCLQHRLPEDHYCPGLSILKKEKRDEINKQLIENSCKSKKI